MSFCNVILILWNVRSCNGRELPVEDWRIVRDGWQVGAAPPLGDAITL